MVVDRRSFDVRSTGGEKLASACPLERVLRLLVATRDDRSLSGVTARGSLILRHLYGGDASAWRMRRRSVRNPVRRLAAHADCPWGADTLDRWVALHVACAQSPELVTAYPRATVSHLAAVLPLSVNEQHAFLAQADAQRLTVHALRRRVAAHRRKRGERRGRRPKLAPAAGAPDSGRGPASTAFA